LCYALCRILALKFKWKQNTSTVSSEDNAFVIEDLDACVEYEVSVRAVNGKDNSTNAVTCKMTTATAVNYHVKIIF
jgi:hypothetical protein